MDSAETLQRLKRAIGSGKGSSDFDLNPEFRPPDSTKLRPAGVLVAVSLWTDTPRVILTKRASHLKHHPGQIAFPGGKVDEADEGSVVSAALREAHEEIGLRPSDCQILGELPVHQTVTNFSVTPILGILTQPFSPVPEPGEVDEVFSVPLAHVLDPNKYLVQWRVWRGVRRHYFTIPYGPYYIWGATARMLRVLADRAVLE